MKQYRLRAYFKDDSPYNARTYRRGMFMSYEDAKEILPLAEKYYRGYKGYMRVAIEEREVSDWTESERRNI